MSWLLTIIGWLGGKDNIVSKAIDLISKSKDVDLAKFQTATGAGKEVIIAALEAEKTHAQTYAMQWGWAPFRWLLFCAAAPAVIHSGAVYLDSTFKFGWAIARAPGVYEGLEMQIIMAVVGAQVSQSLVGAFMGWVQKR